MKLKNLVILGIIAMPFMGFKCKKDDLVIKINSDKQTATFVIKQTPSAGDMSFGQQDFLFNVDSICNANSLTKDNIKTVKIKMVDLLIPDSNKLTFGVVNWAEAYVGESGKAGTLVAAKNPVDKNSGNTISLDLKDVNLADIFKSGKVSFEAKGATNQALAKDVSMVVTFQLEIGTGL